MSVDFAEVTRWRDEYTARRDRLIADYKRTRRPQPLLNGLSRAADRLFHHIWAAHDLAPGAALVAVGGYGREEMYPQSDVDVLILLDDSLPESEHARFEPLIGLFWDVGLPVGHSIRTLTECLAESARDVTIQTNLLEARFLAGNRTLFDRFRQRYQAAMDPLAFFEAKRQEQRNRHGRFADRALLLEPNIKENAGGLRDMQTVAWVCKAAGLPADLPGQVKEGLLDASEARHIATRLGFLSRLRIDLHLAARRREERVLFELQEPLAAEFGLKPRGRLRASEVLMQRYFQAARELSLANEFLIGAVQCRLKPATGLVPLSEVSPFLRQANHLDIYDEALFENDPGQIFNAFLTLQTHTGLQGFAPRALRALWRAGRRIDAAFRHNPAHRKQFIALLKADRGITLTFRLMHRLGILGRYLPAFRRITGQMQHDLYHIHPVDEHTLMVLRNLRRLALPLYAHELPFAHRLMAEFRQPHLLYLAALFHDIAKGRGGDHSSLGEVDARRFCRTHGLSQEETEQVAWLVRDHLALSSTAQKQDLSDPEVITDFAHTCGSIERLTALYLLTAADIRGTNPKIWNAWKDKLLKELYLASRRVLEGGLPVQDSVEAKKEQARAGLRLYGFSEGAERKLWNRLDDVWFLRLEAQEIAWQTRRLLPLLGREETVVRARLAPIGEGVEILVYTPDREGLFARICGFFARMNYGVLQAKIHTTRDGYALDSFLAMDEGQRDVSYRDILSYIEFELTEELKQAKPLADAYAGRLSRQLKSFPLEPGVSLTAGVGGDHWLLAISAGDRPALLYDVARLLNRHRISVQSARIVTLGMRVEDSFVLQSDKLEQDSERLVLEQDLLNVLKVA
jgi:[protein-PII] uridylyltransferase